MAWAITMAPVGVEFDRWSLFLVDADGHRPKVAPTWKNDDWHRVRTFVEEGTCSLAIQVDGAEDATVVDLGLPASHRVAAGDTWDGENLAWTGTGIGYDDNLAVVPWAVAA